MVRPGGVAECGNITNRESSAAQRVLLKYLFGLPGFGSWAAQKFVIMNVAGTKNAVSINARHPPHAECHREPTDRDPDPGDDGGESRLVAFGVGVLVIASAWVMRDA
jgi:hypothetical protein